MILTLDLAAKYSAGVVLDLSGQVKYQFDSFQKSASALADEVVEVAEEFSVSVAVVEDVPYGIRSQAQVKPVLRVQGMLMKAFIDEDILDKLRFLSPSVWQRSVDPRFEGVWKGGASGARAAAERFGYSPPVLKDQYAGLIPESGKERTQSLATLRKLQSDYDDAFLIGQWALIVGKEALHDLTQPPYI